MYIYIQTYLSLPLSLYIYIYIYRERERWQNGVVHACIARWCDDRATYADTLHWHGTSADATANVIADTSASTHVSTPISIHTKGCTTRVV